ncbi:MAG: hypothetical protein ACHQ1D_13925, partial [Nitrososphaerales archaeon]
LLKHLKNPLYHLQSKNPRPILTQLIREKIKPSHKFFWIPGHSKITNHIITDNLTKFNFAHHTLTDAFLELDEALDLVGDTHTALWRKEWPLMKGSEDYTKNHHPAKIHHHSNIPTSNRKQEKIINRIRLNACNLNFYQHKVGLCISPLCETCQSEETIIHFVTICTKHKQLQDTIKTLSKRSTLEPSLINITNNTNILKRIANYISGHNINF